MTTLTQTTAAQSLAPRRSARDFFADLADAADLRRRRRRDLADHLVARADLLLPEDRALIHALFRDGLTARDVAELRAASPRAVRRRARAVVQRMLTPRFDFVADHRHAWPPTRRKVAAACVLQGRPLRDAARHLRLSLHTVRRHMDAVAALQEAHR